MTRRTSTPRATPPASTKLRGLSILGIAAGAGLLLTAQSAGAVPFSAALQQEAPSGDYFNQLANQIASGIASSKEKANDWQSSSHPLPRKRQATPLNMLPAVGGDATAQGQDEAGEDGAGDGSHAGRGPPTAAANADAAAAQPASAPPAALAASAASASPESQAAVSAAVEASGASEAAAPPPSVAAPSESAPPAASATPSPAAPSPSASASPSKAAASDSSASASGTTKPKPDASAKAMAALQQEKNENAQEPDSTSLLSPKNKLFPLVIAGIAVGGIIALMIIIAIARAFAHDSMKREERRRAQGGYSDKGDRLTSAAPGMSAARSIRRAITKKKLGSFARRQQDGSVLIDVGDEVFAVPAHLAESYRQEMIRERKALSLGSGSQGSEESIPDGPFGRVKPRHLKGGGPDVEGWRAKLAYEQQANGAGSGKPTRTLSQRLVDRLRSLTRKNMDDEDDLNEKGDAKEAFSFDTSRQSKGAMREGVLSSQVPILTHGSSDWAVTKASGTRDAERPQDPRSRDVRPKVDVARKPVPYNTNDDRKSKNGSLSHLSWDGSEADAVALNARLIDLEKQAGSSDRRRRNEKKTSNGRLPAASELSHERITLTDEPTPSSSSAGHGSGMGTYAASRSDLHASSHGHTSGYTPSDSSHGTAPNAGTVEAGRVEIKHAQRAKSIRPVPVDTYRHRKAQHPAHRAVAARTVEQLDPDSSARRTFKDGYPKREKELARAKTQRHAADQRKRLDRHTTTAGPKASATSTFVASPQLFQSRQSIGQGMPILMRPEMPDSARVSTIEGATAKALRPLPLPPHLSPLVP